MLRSYCCGSIFYRFSGCHCWCRFLLDLGIQPFGYVEAQRQNGVEQHRRAPAAALGSLFALAEDYPELEASNAFQQLQVRISSLENAIADRREYFNDAVNNNNIVVESFPTNLVANQYHFIPRKQFKVEERKRVDVDVEALFD